MAVIGKINTIVSANTAPLSAEMGKARGIVGGFAKAVTGLGAALGPVVAIIGGAVAAFKAFSAVKTAFTEIDDIAKFSAQTGIATEELVGLQHAATLSGVSFEDLRRAQQRALREGHGDIAELADRMAALESPVEKAQFAYEAMGRTGQELIPLLQQGGDAIRRMVEEGKELAGFSGVDAAKVEAANDAIARMKLAFKGVARSVAIVVAPAVQLIGDKLTSLGKWIRRTFESIRPIVSQFVNVGIAAFNLLWNTAQSIAEAIGSFFGTTFDGLGDTILEALIVAEFGFNNFGAAAALAWEHIKLGAVSAFEDVKFFFGEQLPVILRNMVTVFGDVVDNMGTLWQGLVAFMAGDSDAIGRAIRNGQWRQLAELPTRARTEFESELGDNIARMTDALRADFTEFRQRRLEDLFRQDEARARSPFAGGLDEGGGGKGFDFGLTQAQKQAIQLAALGRGGGADPAEQTARNTEALLEESRAQSRSLNSLLEETRNVQAPQVATIP